MAWMSQLALFHRYRPSMRYLQPGQAAWLSLCSSSNKLDRSTGTDVMQETSGHLLCKGHQQRWLRLLWLLAGPCLHVQTTSSAAPQPSNASRSACGETLTPPLLR